MNILFIASEMTPFCKTGGLADVIGDLPRALVALGHDVSVMLPGYAAIDRTAFSYGNTPTSLVIPVGTEWKHLKIASRIWNGVTVYLIENEGYFDRPGLYGDADGDYPDNGERFIFFAQGALETARHLGLMPDIIHCHDWQTGLVPAYLKTCPAKDGWFDSANVFFTIHNLGYQGQFHRDLFDKTGLPAEAFDWQGLEFWGKVSFLKAGIVYSDVITTVSETYAEEITHEHLGFGMHEVLAARRTDLHGIVNGIDPEIWNPATDPVLPATYSADNLSGKRACRKALLDHCKITCQPDVPIFGMVTRLDDQKGLDILEAAIGRLMALNIRIVVLGTGAKQHQETMTALAERHAGCLHITLGFDNDLAHLIYAGADAFLMPSRYEPCGLGQLIAMRYGALPVVHATGGLVDTVTDLDAFPRKGDGFSFSSHEAEALVDTVARACGVFRAVGHKRWTAAVRRAMTRDDSWTHAAGRYIALYRSGADL